MLKFPTHECVPFQQHVCKPNLFLESIVEAARLLN